MKKRKKVFRVFAVAARDSSVFNDQRPVLLSLLPMVGVGLWVPRIKSILEVVPCFKATVLGTSRGRQILVDVHKLLSCCRVALPTGSDERVSGRRWVAGLGKVHLTQGQSFSLAKTTLSFLYYAF
jgi:hypothetical protein